MAQNRRTCCRFYFFLKTNITRSAWLKIFMHMRQNKQSIFYITNVIKSKQYDSTSVYKKETENID